MLRSRPCGENCCKDAHLSETTSDHDRPARSAERFPDRTAPSIVAGSPVSVQSPARKRLLQAVALPGRLAFWAGVAAKVARRSRTICHGGMALGVPATIATSSQIFLASVSRGISSNRSAALMVTDTLCLKQKSHSTVPFTTPTIGASDGGGSILKCALTIARNSFGLRQGPERKLSGDVRAARPG